MGTLGVPKRQGVRQLLVIKTVTKIVGYSGSQLFSSFVVLRGLQLNNSKLSIEHGTFELIILEGKGQVFHMKISPINIS